ncbi:MAG: hypothetical protein ACLFWB_11400, partial [Armatimonadota bacterium]
MSALKWLCIATLILLVPGAYTMANDTFHAVTLVDPDNPVSPEWLQKAGIDYVYTSAPRQMDTDANGEPVLPEKQGEQWNRLQATYAGTGIKILVMSNYYQHPPEGAEAVDCAGETLDMACLYQDEFYEWMRQVIIEQAKAYSRYNIFGGFVFDDGWGTRVDACYCDTCRELFAGEYGKEPPPFEVHRGTGVIDDDDALLEWEEFQRAAYDRYVREQSEAVRSVSDDLLMFTIPSDSYFYGRLLHMNAAREELADDAGALIQRIERCQVEDWFLYQSFPLPRLPEADEEGLQHFGVGIHITAQSPKLILSTEGPFAPTRARLQMMSPDEIAQMARITITEGANAVCYWVSGHYTALYPDGYDGMAEVYDDLQAVGDLLADREPVSPEVGLLYSTTTEVMEQPWQENTAERWQHLHSVEGTAFALLRGNIPFRIVMEDQIADGALEGLKALVVPSARFLSQSAHRAINAAAEDGLAVCVCGPCVEIDRSMNIPYDVAYWHRRVQKGYRQRSYLDAQYIDACSDMLPLLRDNSDLDVSVASDAEIGKIYSAGEN